MPPRYRWPCGDAHTEIDLLWAADARVAVIAITRAGEATTQLLGPGRAGFVPVRTIDSDGTSVAGL